MKRTRFYLAHPVGGDVPGNVARVLRWYKALTLAHPMRLYTIPWLPDVLAFDDSNPAERAAGFDRNMKHLAAVEDIVLCGGRISAGMAVEVQKARELGLFVHDLTPLGEEPPEVIP